MGTDVDDFRKMTLRMRLRPFQRAELFKIFKKDRRQAIRIVENSR